MTKDLLGDLWFFTRVVGFSFFAWVHAATGDWFYCIASVCFVLWTIFYPEKQR